MEWFCPPPSHAEGGGAAAVLAAHVPGSFQSPASLFAPLALARSDTTGVTCYLATAVARGESSDFPPATTSQMWAGDRLA